MARKKAAAAGRKTVRKKTAGRKAARKKAGKKTAGKKTAGKKTRDRKKVAGRTGRSPQKLGRARITGDARLDEFFRRDYEARQVFEFLNVQSVRELEQYSPDEIIDQLTAPMLRTIDRIRKALALNNRALKGDERYAVEFLSAIGGIPRARRTSGRQE